MIEMETPCMKCSSRYVGCHSQCDRYKQYKADLQEVKDKIYKTEEINRYISVGICKSKKCKEYRNYGLNN